MGEDHTEPRGQIALIAILIVTAVALAAALSASFTNRGGLARGLLHTQSQEAFANAEKCLEEALLRLKNDSSYGGGADPFGDGSCSITISGGTITVTGKVAGGKVFRKIQATVTVTLGNVQLNTWQEVP